MEMTFAPDLPLGAALVIAGALVIVVFLVFLVIRPSTPPRAD